MEDQSEHSMVDIGVEGINMELDATTDLGPMPVQPFVLPRSNEVMQAVFQKWEAMNSVPSEQTGLQQEGREDELMPMDIDEPVSEDTTTVSPPSGSPQSSSAGIWSERIRRKQIRAIERPMNPLRKINENSISLILRARLTAISKEGELSSSENKSMREEVGDIFEVVDNIIPEDMMIDRPSELQEDVGTIIPEEIMVNQLSEINTIALLEDLADSFSRFRLEG